MNGKEPWCNKFPVIIPVQFKNFIWVALYYIGFHCASILWDPGADSGARESQNRQKTKWTKKSPLPQYQPLVLQGCWTPSQNEFKQAIKQLRDYIRLESGMDHTLNPVSDYSTGEKANFFATLYQPCSFPRWLFNPCGNVLTQNN